MLSGITLTAVLSGKLKIIKNSALSLSKGFFKNPSFYLKIFLTAILFGGLILGSNIALKILPSKEFSSLMANSANTFLVQGVFIEPAKNFLEDSPDIVFLQENSIWVMLLPLQLVSRFWEV